MFTDCLNWKSPALPAAAVVMLYFCAEIWYPIHRNYESRNHAVENYFQINLSKNEMNAISNLGLAHMGDAVFEVLCRSYLCVKGDHTALKLHRDAVELVKATSQAKFADALLPYLTEEETAFYRRGKNAHVRVPKSATPQEYAKATGVEALFGALYLSGQTKRINELFNIVMEELYGL